MTAESKVIKVYESFKLGYCRCGCSTEIQIKNASHNFLKIYHKGHHRRGADFGYITGQNNKWYKTGIRYRHNYRYILMPDYFSAQKDGYVVEHIYVYQEYYKVCILPWTEIHHKDPVREGWCNNMIWNLLLLSKSEHRTLDRTKNMDARRCSKCGKTKTYVKKNGRPMWYGKIELLCKRCYDKKMKK